MDATRLRIAEDDAGQRVDRFVRKLLPGLALSAVYKLLRSGRVRVDGAKVGPGARLGAGQELSLAMPADELARLGFGGPTRRAAPAPAPALPPPEVVYEDDDLCVVVKPAGLAVHEGTGHERDSLAARVRARLGDRGALRFRPAPAHRLDRDSSGLVAFGKTAAGLRGLAAAFRARDLRKLYLAVVDGRPPARGELGGRFSVREQAGAAEPRLVPDPEGAEARLTFSRLAAAGAHALCEVELGTGRRHQIRAQLAAAGHALAGDLRYGGRALPEAARRAAGGRRFLLHAWRLELRHPLRDEVLALEAPLPEDLRAALAALGLPWPPRR
ncbi:MAG: RluA family pseudouridine synthase [Planctomycetota bacterium]